MFIIGFASEAGSTPGILTDPKMVQQVLILAASYGLVAAFVAGLAFWTDQTSTPDDKATASDGDEPESESIAP